MDLIDQMKQENIIMEGHFKLRSGKHSNFYINKDSIYSNPELFSRVGIGLVEKIQQNFNDYDIITGPAIAGAILASPISIILNKTFVYPEKIQELSKISLNVSGSLQTEVCNIIKNEYMGFRRGYDKLLKDKKVVIVEDIVTTGNSILLTKDAVELCGGKVIGCVVIWNRSGDDTILPLEMHSLIKNVVKSWDLIDCPLCSNKVELTDPKN
jgi:orotate phosphoribosyltransferase